MLKRHSRYILKQVLPFSCIAIIISLSVLLLERALRLLSFVLESNRSAQFLIELLTWLMPYYLGFALPCALFIGILAAFSRLSRDREIHAFLALGFSLSQLIRPVIGLALVMMAIVTVLFSHIQPHARYIYSSLQETTRHAAIYRFADSSVFAKIGNWTLIIDSVDTANRNLHGILAFAEKSNRSITLSARRGIIYPSSAQYNHQPVLTLYDGNRLEIVQPDKQPEIGIESIDNSPAEHTQNNLRFKEMSARLTFLPDLIVAPRGTTSPRQLTIPELFTGLQTEGHRGFTKARLLGELHGRIVRVFTILLLPFLAIAFGMSPRQGHQAYRFIIGMGVIFAMHLILKYGEVMVERGTFSPLMGLWIPFIAFFGGTLIFFHQVTTRVCGRRYHSVLFSSSGAAGTG